jgi:hypothetical protein
MNHTTIKRKRTKGMEGKGREGKGDGIKKKGLLRKLQPHGIVHDIDGEVPEVDISSSDRSKWVKTMSEAFPRRLEKQGKIDSRSVVGQRQPERVPLPEPSSRELELMAKVVARDAASLGARRRGVVRDEPFERGRGLVVDEDGVEDVGVVGRRLGEVEVARGSSGGGLLRGKRKWAGEVSLARARKGEGGRNRAGVRVGR